MRFKGKSSIWKCPPTGMGTVPKQVDTEFRVFRPNLSENPNGTPIFECRVKKNTYKFNLTLGSCDVLCPPNASDKITLKFKKSNMFVMISSIAPADQRGMKFLAEHFSKGMHKNEAERVKQLLHNPYGCTTSTAPKPEPKQLELVGSEAKLNFQKKLKFSENLQALRIADRFLQLDGRIFVLENLQELRLENIGLSNSKNQSILTNLCRLSNLKTLSFANNGLTELAVDVWEALPVGLQGLILCKNLLTTLPRQLKRCKNLLLLDARMNNIGSIHEDVGKLRKLQVLRMEKNKLQLLPYCMFYGRQFNELNLTENPQLFTANTIVAHRQELVKNSEGTVPKLNYLTVARMLNLNQHSETLLPPHLKDELNDALHLCFMCMKYVPIYGQLNVKYGQFDVRDFSSDTYYNQAELSANYVAHVCLDCKPKAVRLKIFT